MRRAQADAPEDGSLIGSPHGKLGRPFNVGGFCQERSRLYDTLYCNATAAPHIRGQSSWTSQASRQLVHYIVRGKVVERVHLRRLPSCALVTASARTSTPFHLFGLSLRNFFLFPTPRPSKSLPRLSDPLRARVKASKHTDSLHCDAPRPLL